MDGDRLDGVGASDLVTQCQGRLDAGLGVILDRPDLDVGLVDHVGAATARELIKVQGAGDLRLEAFRALEGLDRPGHPQRGQPCREEAVAGGIGRGAGLPHRHLADACLAKRAVAYRRQRQGLAHLPRVEAEHASHSHG